VSTMTNKHRFEFKKTLIIAYNTLKKKIKHREESLQNDTQY